VDPYIREKDIKAAVITRPVNSNNQNRSGKQNGARGCRLGRGAEGRQCAAKDDRGQKRAFWMKSHRSGTRYR
jgi:hypothetical protein